MRWGCAIFILVLTVMIFFYALAGGLWSVVIGGLAGALLWFIFQGHKIGR